MNNEIKCPSCGRMTDAEDMIVYINEEAICDDCAQNASDLAYMAILESDWKVRSK